MIRDSRSGITSPGELPLNSHGVGDDVSASEDTENLKARRHDGSAIEYQSRRITKMVGTVPTNEECEIEKRQVEMK